MYSYLMRIKETTINLPPIRPGNGADRNARGCMDSLAVKLLQSVVIKNCFTENFFRANVNLTYVQQSLADTNLGTNDVSNCFTLLIPTAHTNATCNAAIIWHFIH